MKAYILCLIMTSMVIGALMVCLIVPTSITDTWVLYLAIAINLLTLRVWYKLLIGHTQLVIRFKMRRTVDKSDAYQYMLKGFKIRHETWDENMYIWMPFHDDKTDKSVIYNVIHDENGNIFDFITYQTPGEWILLK